VAGQRPLGVAKNLVKNVRHLLNPKWLAEDVRRPTLAQLPFRVLSGVSTHETAAKIRVDHAECSEGLRSIEPRHLHIEEHNGDFLAASLVDFESFLADARQQNREAVAPEAEIQKGPNPIVVIHNEDAWAGRGEI
jgi:hypothetical protein